MDFSNANVVDYVYECMKNILENNAIDYVKWDFNRAVTENFSRALPAERQQEMHHRYALGLYDLCERLINGFPHIFFEGCAGGGGRFDPGMLYISRRIYEDVRSLKLLDSDGYLQDGSNKHFFPHGFHQYIHAETLVGGYTEIMPGRPTIAHQAASSP